MLKLLLIGCLVFLTNISIYAGEAKGYKIVLASYKKFDDAKQALQKLETKIDTNEERLQNKYQYEIVARPSGHAFILGVEPIETKETANILLKEFHHLYAGAYVDKYYGLTEGTIFLKHPKTASSTVEVSVELNTTKTPVVHEVKPIEKQEIKPEVINTVPQHTRHSKSNAAFYTILILSILSIFLFIKKIGGRTRTLQHKLNDFEKKSDKNDEEDRVSAIEAAAEVEEDSADETEQPTEKTFLPEEDVFFKLKKNMFFMTVLNELKLAADEKDDARSYDLFQEILRYQKNFRKSAVISEMEQLVNAKELNKLSILITKEI